MFQYEFGMTQTLAIAIVVLLIGKWVKKQVVFFEKYFIPAPVIGGVIYSIFALVGRMTGAFEFEFDSILKDFLMIAFFTTIGFTASFKLLKKGGVQVFIFLAAATGLVICQNIIGISLAKVFNMHPLMGLATGSIPLTGGHGTAAAFGPALEAGGAVGATTVAIAGATFGLIAGCLLGGPVAKRLMIQYKLIPNKEEDFLEHDKKDDHALKEKISETSLFTSIVYISIAMGLGTLILPIFKKLGITLPVYIGAMIIAAIIRNILDAKQNDLPLHTIDTIGSLSLQLFLAMALMSMKLWELADLAGPLVVIMLIQTAFMAFFAYFITFRSMGSDYDAAVIATGHCGFGLGATPNAMANMESFTAANGPSPNAFFVLPLVGALFIDFSNAAVITTFLNIFG